MPQCTTLEQKGVQGAVSIRKTVLPGMAIPMLKITWKSPYVDKTVFILRRGPGVHEDPVLVK